MNKKTQKAIETKDLMIKNESSKIITNEKNE